jgi:hypothetical protein
VQFKFEQKMLKMKDSHRHELQSLNIKHQKDLQKVTEEFEAEKKAKETENCPKHGAKITSLQKQIKIYKQDGVQKQLHIITLNDEKNRLEKLVEELKSQVNMAGVRLKRPTSSREGSKKRAVTLRTTAKPSNVSTQSRPGIPMPRNYNMSVQEDCHPKEKYLKVVLVEPNIEEEERVDGNPSTLLGNHKLQSEYQVTSQHDYNDLPEVNVESTKPTAGQTIQIDLSSHIKAKHAGSQEQSISEV